VAALPDAVRVELEAVQDGGGLQHLQEVSAQIRVRWYSAWGAAQLASAALLEHPQLAA
jgi:hypothetical protein